MGKPTLTETYISVDVETAGPNPGTYSLLSIGACTVAKPRRTFYVELQPVNDNSTPQAMAIHHMSLADLAEHGLPAPEAMARFADWLASVLQPGEQPVFVAFNAPFDWMFVCDYFHRFLGSNPFGHAALDIKAYYMGLKGIPWAETSMRYIGRADTDDRRVKHHALHDAIYQAEVFHKMLTRDRKDPPGPTP